MLPPDPLLPLLLAVPVVVLACYAGGNAARRMGQPPVIGEIVVGVLLGPTFLGWLAPAFQTWLLPPAVMPVTSALGNLALLVFLFLIGLELDLPALRSSGRAMVAVAVTSVVLPLALGAGVAVAMYPQLAPPGVQRLPFTLFVALSLSITAFPVLARILADRDLQGTRLGTFVMAVAAADDALAWCLLTVVVALCTAGTPLAALVAVVLAATLTLTLARLRPALRQLLRHAAAADRARVSRCDEVVLVLLCAGLFLTAYATDRIGVHPAFGAFLFGAVTPRGIPAVERSSARLHTVIIPILLPLFFVDIGLHTDVGELAPGQWGWAAAILIIALIGKWCGAAAACRLGGSGWRWAASVGTLMNCRGLTELVVLGIGRQLGVITPELFTILVVMALVTTVATGPLLGRLLRGDPALVGPPEPDGANARQDQAAAEVTTR